MARKDMKKALGASLKAEERAVKDRFEMAETALAKTGTASKASDNGVERVIRDSFTMPALDYSLISKIKDRCLKKGIVANKSEIVRAGLAILDGFSDTALADLLKKLPKVKTGRRPAKK
jgi:hypothetical protein